MWQCNFFQNFRFKQEAVLFVSFCIYIVKVNDKYLFQWVPRSVKQSQNQGPKTLDQVRCDMSELYPTLLDDIPSTFNHEDYKSNITLANSM